MAISPPAHHTTSTLDPSTPDTIHDRIVAAAFEMASLHGISKLSMGDVAKQAGLSRQTLYRHFPSKAALVEAVVFDQSATLIANIVEAAQPDATPMEALRAGLAAALTAVRDHPLLRRLLIAEPEALLPLLVANDSSVMELVRAAVESITTEHILDRPNDGFDAELVRRFADIVTRLIISYAASPSADDPAEIASGIAAILIHGALSTSGIGSPAGHHPSTNPPHHQEN